MENLINSLKKFLNCYDTSDPEDTGIIDLKIPLLISKVSEDETTIVSKDKYTLLQIARRVIAKKKECEEVTLDGDYLKVGNAKFYIEKIQIDEHIRFSCNIVYTLL